MGAGVKRDINYLARDTLFRYPVVGWVLRNGILCRGIGKGAVPQV